MSEKEQLSKLLEKIGVSSKLNSILASPQTHFTDGKLESVDLSDLGITSLTKDVFNGFSDLTSIHLSFNKLTELPQGIFNDVKNVTLINFYGNQLTELPDDIFEGLSKLEWIDLRSNNLRKLPKSLGSLANLEYLFLQNNELEEYADTKYDWGQDYHSKRDVQKFMPEFQEYMGLAVTGKKPLTREEIAEQELKKRQAKESSS